MSFSDLPESWETVPLKEITLPQRTVNPANLESDFFSYVDIDALDNGRQRIVSPKRIPCNKAISRARMLLASGDIIYSLVRPYLRNIAIVPEELDDAIASTAYAVLRPAKGVKSRFLFYQVAQDTFINSIPTYGNSPPSARDDEFFALDVKLPPVNEQRRIVAKLDELFSDLDAGVAALKRARANLKRYRASVLKAAVEGRLTADWRAANPPQETGVQILERILVERRRKWEEDQLAKFKVKGQTPSRNWRDKYPEPAKPDKSGLPELPEGWCWATMDQIVISGPQNGLYLPKENYGEGTPILRIDDFQNDFSKPSSELKRVNASQQDASTYSLNEGDIVINRVNSLTHLGKCLFTEDRNIPSVFESNMMRLSVSCFMDGRHVVNYLQSCDGRARLISNAKHAVNQASINQTDVLTTAIPICSLTEQNYICMTLESILTEQTATLASLDIQLRRASRLRQAILKRAFEGKLVPQDPDDEPASVLLERIKAECAAQGAAPKARLGRPPKVAAPTPTVLSGPAAPKRRGRPRKVPQT